MYDQKLDKAVCVIVRNRKNNLILAVSRRGHINQWGLPGGKVIGDESFEAACIRELREETGFIVDKNNLTRVFRGICGPGPDGKVFDVVSYEATDVFLGNSNGGDAGPVDWVTEEQLMNGPFGEYNKALFEHIYKSRLFKRVSEVWVDKDRMSGFPCLFQHRITLSHILALVADGMSINEIAEEFELEKDQLERLFKQLASEFNRNYTSV